VQNSDNFYVREQCALFLDFDILGIAESHLRNNDAIYLSGYSWFGNNRKNIHVNARSGSGGVGFLILIY
jgi:hypothetical protein